MTRDESFTVARVIMREAPVLAGRLGVAADVLALLVLLDGFEIMRVRRIRRALEIPQATASDLIARAVTIGFVEARRVGRETEVELTATGKRMRQRRRGNK